MSMIFDGFTARARANAFREKVEREFKLGTQVYLTVEAAQDADPFPFELKVPIVHVDRPDTGSFETDGAIESRVIALVGDFGGEFAGT